MFASVVDIKIAVALAGVAHVVLITMTAAVLTVKHLCALVNPVAQPVVGLPYRRL